MRFISDLVDVPEVTADYTTPSLVTCVNCGAFLDSASASASSICTLCSEELDAIEAELEL
jgi:hypothetical protein